MDEAAQPCTVDQRTRGTGQAGPLDVASFLGDVAPEALDANGRAVGVGAALLGLVPLTFHVGGEVVTLLPTGDGVEIERGDGPEGAVAVALDESAFADLVQDEASTFGVVMSGRAKVVRGRSDDFVVWEPALRCLLDGRPVYAPGSIDLADRDGALLDLRRSFCLDDDPAEIGHFLSQAGFLHIESVFTDEEMAAVSAELDQAIAGSSRDDGETWWAQTAAGEWYPARILGFNRKSAALRDLLHDRRFATVGTFTDDEFVQSDPDHCDSAEGLLKKVGIVRGISDVSWHKDCSLGGHSRTCSGLTVGISITGAGPENGELGVVPGSHRANVAQLGIQGLDLPTLARPTATGDLTVHCSCTLHMSRPPVSAERRVVYTGFGLAPRAGDHVVERDADDLRRERAALNDEVVRASSDGTFGRRASSYEL